MRSLAFAFTALLVMGIASKGDELDWNKHHPSGAALIAHDGREWFAAYQLDDFDPGHSSAPGLHQLFRLVLVPADAELLALPFERDAVQHVGNRALLSGHSVLDLGDWVIEFIASDVSDRDMCRANAGISADQLMRVRFERRRDAVLITVMR